MKKGSILIVDPERSHRDYLTMVLSSQGFDVFSVPDGFNALNYLANLAPDIILLDEAVNGLTPEELSQELQTKNLDSFFIVMCQQADLDHSMNWIMAGALSCLSKPVQFEKLEQAIAAGLENKEVFHEILELTRELKNANKKLEKNQELLVKERSALREKTDQIRFLYELSTELSASLRSHAVFDLVNRALARLIKPSLTVILSDCVPNEKLRLYSSRCLNPELTARLAEELTSQMNKDLSKRGIDCQILKPSRSNRRLSCRPPHQIILPLVVSAEKYGLLALYFHKKPKVDADRMLLLESVAMQAAQALRNSHQHEAALQMANRDPLTGLFNRRAFEARLDQEFKRVLRHRRPMSLIMLDLDCFKTVNDRFGHQTGDKVLRTAAQVIADCTRETDITARYGGDEFAVILPDTPPEKAFLLAKRIKRKLTETEIPVTENHHKLTISQGLAATDIPLVKQSSDLINLADQALYRAKEDGRNTIRTTKDLKLKPQHHRLKEVSHA